MKMIFFFKKLINTTKEVKSRKKGIQHIKKIENENLERNGKKNRDDNKNRKEKEINKKSEEKKRKDIKNNYMVYFWKYCIFLSNLCVSSF